MSIRDLRNALEDIKAHPHDWQQDTWFCGTKACLAGRIVLRAGWQPLETDYLFLVVDPATGRTGEPGTIAADIIGITHAEGNVLWNSSNTLDDLEHYTTRLEADRAVYRMLTSNQAAWQHCWVDRTERVQIGAHRRTSYVRIGGCIETKDWDSRAEAIDYAETCAQGRLLAYHHNYDLRALAAA